MTALLPTRQAGAVRRILVLGLLVAAACWLVGCMNLPNHRNNGEICVVDKPLGLTAEQLTQDLPAAEIDFEAVAGGARPCAKRWQVRVDRPQPFSMNFVEIDEQGLLTNRAQADGAIRTASAPEDKGSLVVVFVHGWHHNAASTDANVKAFYKALARVSQWNPNRRVKGIYIGWRGESLPLPGLKYLTFWERKATSDEVGRGSLLEFLLKLERGVKPRAGDGATADATAAAAAAANRNRLVVVSHSFGASVTFNALAHVYLERLLDGLYASSGPAGDEGPRFRGYGDLVVLLNPAIEAMRFMPFQSALEYHARTDAKPKLDFSKEIRPYLVVLSSESDWATGLVFPVARFFTTLFEAHSNVTAELSPAPDPDAAAGAEKVPAKRYSEWNMDRDALGNFEHFHTHQPLTLDPSAVTAAAADVGGLSRNDRCQPPDRFTLRALLNATGTGEYPSSGVFKQSGVRLRRIPNELLVGSPYLVAKAGADLIDGHNDIGRPNLVCWINQLLDTDEVSERPPIAAAKPAPAATVPATAPADPQQVAAARGAP